VAAPAGGPRKVLVLGASSTIGAEVCARYAEAGYHVLAHYHRNRAAVEGLARAHPGVEPVPCDLADLHAVASLAATEEVQACDALVCLAAVAAPTVLEALDVDALVRTVSVGALANYVVMGALGPSMADRGYGRIVIGSSIGVKFGGGTDSFAYALANHASEFIPRAAAQWAGRGVLTNVVRIGVTDTPIHEAFPGRDMAARASLIPMHRLAQPAEVAALILDLGTERNTYVTGQVTAVSGGE